MDQPFLVQPEALKLFQLAPGGTSTAQLGGKGLSEVHEVEKVFAAHEELLGMSPSSPLQTEG